MSHQPRLRFWFAEFYDRAKTITGDVWWWEEKRNDGTIRRIPLVPIDPVAFRTKAKGEKE